LLSGVFVIEKDEVVGFRKLGVEEAKIKIVGDTKYDQVFDRSQKREKIAPLLNHPVLQNKQVLVAGSTWPADEEIVIPAFCSVAKKVDKLLLIIAPHESQTKRITEIEHLCRQFHLKSVRWSELAKLTNDCQCLIIDQIGLLSSIYSLGKVAFVGGSFYYKIHNVLEPAVFGIPVFFGPKMTTSAEALKLLENEAAIMVTSVKQVADLLTKIFKDSVYANRYGDRAKKLVYQNTGSSRKIAELLIGNLNTFSGKGKGMGKENI
jgi:3-deoxy-D-manno-octulosonic-acid transferase